MVKHIILWKLNDSCEKDAVKRNAKEALEALNGNIDGLLSLNVITDALPSSNADMMLDSSFEDIDALKAYQVNPMHKNAADTFVRPFFQVRLCLDFEE